MMGLVLWKVNILKQYTVQPDDENLAVEQLLTISDLTINGERCSRAAVHLLKHWIRFLLILSVCCCNSVS